MRYRRVSDMFCCLSNVCAEHAHRIPCRCRTDKFVVDGHETRRGPISALSSTPIEHANTHIYILCIRIFTRGILKLGQAFIADDSLDLCPSKCLSNLNISRPLIYLSTNRVDFVQPLSIRIESIKAVRRWEKYH